MYVWHCAYGPNGALPFSEVATLTNGWHQLFVSVSNGGQTQIYKDGRLTSDTLPTRWPITSLVTLTLGASGNTASLPAIHATTTLDDVRIYNRAFSSDEVAQLYAFESGPRVDLIKAVKPSFSYLSVGTNYQLQLSADMNTWTNHASPFTATNASMVYPQYWDVENWGKLFFRLSTTP